MFYLGLKWFTFLIFLGVVQVAYAFIDGTLTPGQMERRWPGVKHLPLMRHWGIILDFILVSPLLAGLLASYSQAWVRKHIGVAIILAAILGGMMFRSWNGSSKDVYDSFARNGTALLNGWVHYIYMVIALTVILMFYYSTPRVGFGAATGVTLLLLLHVAVGMFQPRMYAWHYIDKKTTQQFFIVVLLLIVSWGRIAFKY